MNLNLHLILVFFAIIVISILQPVSNVGISEHFLVPNTPVIYNWNQGNKFSTHVYSGTQKDDSHTFNSDGNYVKDIGSKNYVDCRNSGFTKEFCLQTPNSLSTNSCMCPDGQLGKIMPGFKGKCVCTTDSFSDNYI